MANAHNLIFHDSLKYQITLRIKQITKHKIYISDLVISMVYKWWYINVTYEYNNVFLIRNIMKMSYEIKFQDLKLLLVITNNAVCGWDLYPKIWTYKNGNYEMLETLLGKLIGKLLSAIWPKQTIFPFLVFYFNTVKLCET